MSKEQMLATHVYIAATGIYHAAINYFQEGDEPVARDDAARLVQRALSESRDILPRTPAHSDQPGGKEKEDKSKDSNPPVHVAPADETVSTESVDATARPVEHTLTPSPKPPQPTMTSSQPSDGALQGHSSQEPFCMPCTLDTLPEYPDGALAYSVDLTQHGITREEASHVGWATYTWYGRHSQDHVLTKKICLGIFACPSPGCEFIRRPRLPMGRSKNEVGRPPKNPDCIHHKVALLLLPCKCNMTFLTHNNTTLITHEGIHAHPQPHPIRPNALARRKLVSIVQVNQEAKIQSLLAGTSTRPPITEIHMAYLNSRRVGRIRKKVTQGNTSSSKSAFGAICSIEKKMKQEFIGSNSVALNNGHICIATVFMRDQLLLRESPFQTDTIEGFIVDAECPGANLTMTSGYCSLLRRTIPLFVTILMGKSKRDYALHFSALFKAMRMSTNIRDWYESRSRSIEEGAPSSTPVSFPGNTSDFSEAERLGFENALRAHCSYEGKLSMDRFYRCCQVHYKRSVLRLMKNSRIVPPKQREVFYKKATGLLNGSDAGRSSTDEHSAAKQPVTSNIKMVDSMSSSSSSTRGNVRVVFSKPGAPTKKRPNKHVPKKRPRAPPMYHKGMQPCNVNQKGVLPMCRGCNKTIDRDDRRLVSWGLVRGRCPWSFHIRHACLEGKLTRQEKKALSLRAKEDPELRCVDVDAL
jgi:hypothetical protein